MLAPPRWTLVVHGGRVVLWDAVHVMVVGAIALQGLANHAGSNDRRARVDIAGASAWRCTCGARGHVGLLPG